MLDAIIAALQARADLTDWSVRQITTGGVQLYAIPGGTIEARRQVSAERFVVEVLRQTENPDGSATSGSGNATLLPGDDIDAALDAAALMAGLVHNQPHSIPGPAELPEVALADPEIQADPPAALAGLMARLQTAAAAHPEVRLTAAEWFAQEQTTRLVNSRGVDATKTGTEIHAEMVLLGREGEREVELFMELSRRCLHDVDVEAEVAQRAQFTLDTLHASAAPTWSGPVVMRGPTLSVFLNGGVIQTLASGAMKFGKASPWEIGQPVFNGPVTGDPLTLYATRQLPYGTNAGEFDEEGIPAQRVELIRDNMLQTFVANQRYADYLGIAPTGAFGDIEVPPGQALAAELLTGSYIEVVDFSWFNPHPISGEFASEIRLGYIVEGETRTPFKGGALVGNVMDALANVRWSRETSFYGDYHGPIVARFGQLTVSGEIEAL